MVRTPARSVFGSTLYDRVCNSSGSVPFSGRRVFSGTVHGTDDDALYRTERVFSVDGYPPARYSIPLPQGSYRVTLHFAEILYGKPGRRVFDVRIEEKVVLERFDPAQAGFATAQQKSFESIQVEDGALDVELIPIAGDPKLTALEVEASSARK